MNPEKDTLYANQYNPPEPFSFNENVAKIFPDMINRSVPGYKNILEGIGLFTRRYVQPNTWCYDLGCSLGAATLEMRHNILVPQVKILAVDNSPAMTLRCQQVIDQDSSITPVEIRTESILDTRILNASVVVLNFTLQFISPKDRLSILKRIFEGLVPGGILVVSEKISYPEPWEQEFFTDIHVDFKRKNGYSDLEISKKRQALENVLVPWTSLEHNQYLGEAGFQHRCQWYGFFQFVSFAAVKIR